MSNLVVYLGLKGRLGDHFDKRHILAIGLILQALGALVLARVDAIWMIIPFVLLYAPGYGCTIPIRPSIAAEDFSKGLIRLYPRACCKVSWLW